MVRQPEDPYERFHPDAMRQGQRIHPDSIIEIVDLLVDRLKPWLRLLPRRRGRPAKKEKRNAD